MKEKCIWNLASSLLELHLVGNQEGTGQDRTGYFFSSLLILIVAGFNSEHSQKRKKRVGNSVCDSLPMSITVRNPWSGEEISGFSHFIKCCSTPRRPGEVKNRLTGTTHFIQQCTQLPLMKGSYYINFVNGGKSSAKLISFWVLGGERERRKVHFKEWGINLLLCSYFSLMKVMLYNDSCVPRSWGEWLKDSKEWNS